MAIVVEIVNRSGQVLNCHVFHKRSVTIGRAYTNDIIIADDYIDPEHAQIHCLDDPSQFLCEDKNSANGIYDKRGHRFPLSTELLSGNTISLGKTWLKISSTLSEVPAATMLSAWERLSDDLSQWRVVFLVTLVCALLLALDIYLSPSLLEDRASEYFLIVYFFIALCTYAGLMAFFGRIFRQDSRFLLYYSLVSVFFVITLAYSFISPIAFFNLNISLAFEWFNHLFYSVMIALLIYMSIRFASTLRFISRFTIASLIPVLVVMNLVVQAIKSEDAFSQLPPYDPSSFYSALHWGSEAGYDDFVVSTSTLYAVATTEIADDGESQATTVDTSL